MICNPATTAKTTVTLGADTVTSKTAGLREHVTVRGSTIDTIHPSWDEISRGRSIAQAPEKVGYSIIGNGPRINTWQAPEDTAKWMFDMQRTGAYEVWVKLSHSLGGSRFLMEFGDQLVETTVPNTGSFNIFAWHRVGMVLVDAAGAQTLAIKPLFSSIQF